MGHEHSGETKRQGMELSGMAPETWLVWGESARAHTRDVHRRGHGAQRAGGPGLVCKRGLRRALATA